MSKSRRSGGLLVRLAVVKAQATTIFSVEPTEYGWSVSDAIDDVMKRQAALKAKGRASSVEVTGEEVARARYSFAKR